MKEDYSITTLFIDIGGVLLTNGWSRQSRKNAATIFNLDFIELEKRHHLTIDTYEVGKINLNEYLNRIVFYEKRHFTCDKFIEFMHAQSKPYTEMIKFIHELKKKHGLKIVVINNEGRELTEHRRKKFKLNEFVYFFLSYCFVYLRKPDADIFRIVLDISQVSDNHVLYIEDRPMLVKVAENLGINAIHHTDYESTISKLNLFRLKIMYNENYGIN
jgi:putative hydrolase of the HAD superfamily